MHIDSIILKYHKDEGAKSHQHEFFFDLAQRCPKALLIAEQRWSSLWKTISMSCDMTRVKMNTVNTDTADVCSRFSAPAAANGISHAHGERECNARDSCCSRRAILCEYQLQVGRPVTHVVRT